MKVTLESTTAIVTLVVDGRDIPARIWQGETEDGIPVHAYITRIVPEVPQSDPEIDAKTAAFERELQRQTEPRLALQPIPMRMII